MPSALDLALSTNLTANTLAEAILKMRYADKLAHVCVTSVVAKLKLENECRQQIQYKNESPLVALNQYAGMQLIGHEEIQTDTAFFFGNVDDANEFIDSCRKLREAKVPWHIVVEAFRQKLRGLM